MNIQQLENIIYSIFYFHKNTELKISLAYNLHLVNKNIICNLTLTNGAQSIDYYVQYVFKGSFLWAYGINFEEFTYWQQRERHDDPGKPPTLPSLCDIVRDKE